ncbi:N-acetylglucosamine-6-phosphate deacetylase [Serinicoccus sp. LYQ131]|uniref:N-acetylglucosamine-6-phosphate deacetylase n=1 Tax=Serinicoccus sp. LYQ131 TaxID=3378797 RepID=UPI003851C7AA
MVLRDGVIVRVGTGEPPGPVAAHGRYLAPGLVDMHCHGGGGHSFATSCADEARAAAATHHAAGVTTVMASLVSDRIEVLEQQLEVLAGVARTGEVAGMHLEGPWLSPAFRGAHPEALLQAPTPGDVDRLLRAGRGHLRMVTLAPELPGALQAVRRLVAAGVVVALGHTGADADTVRTAVDAGASVLTHACNGMRPLHHRDPGPVVAALGDPRVTLEVIGDGVHLHPEVLALICRCAPGRVALVSDAMPAAGRPDGTYRLGAQEVEVLGGVARLAGGGSIAGSTTPLPGALQVSRAAGVPALVALGAATTTPSRVLGLSVGALRPGAPADVLLLDADLQVQQVWRAGVPIGPAHD